MSFKTAQIMCFISNLSVFVQFAEFTTIEFFLLLKKELHWQYHSNIKEKAKATVGMYM